MRSVWKIETVLIVWLLIPPSLYGWTSHVHRQMTALAAQAISRQCPDSVFCKDRLLAGLKEGSVAPDFRGKGSIPPSGHGFNPQAKDGRSTGGACYFYRKTLNHLHLIKSTDEFWFQAGRCLHLIADLAQPFHTGNGNNEQLFHSLYEKEVEKRWVELEPFLGKRVDEYLTQCPDGVVEASTWRYFRFEESTGVFGLPVMTARKGRSRYDDLHRLCRLGPWGEELESLTAAALFDGIVGMVGFLQYVSGLRAEMEKSFNDNCHETFIPEFGFEMFVLWMHAFTYCRCNFRKGLK